MARKIVFGVIIFFFAVQFLLLAAGHTGELIRPDLTAAQLLALMIPVRSVRPNGTRLYSAMLYRLASTPAENGKRTYQSSILPQKLQPLGRIDTAISIHKSS